MAASREKPQEMKKKKHKLPKICLISLNLNTDIKCFQHIKTMQKLIKVCYLSLEEQLRVF